MGAHFNSVRIFFFGKGGNTTNKSVFSYLLVLHKYQMIYLISIILYRYKYRIEKIDRYPALLTMLISSTAVHSTARSSKSY